MSEILETLWKTIEQRQHEMPEGSYTAHLLRAGEGEILKKLGEEAIEVIVAVKGQGNDRVIYEMADLIYHAMVLLAQQGQRWSDVETELARRFEP